MYHSHAISTMEDSGSRHITRKQQQAVTNEHIVTNMFLVLKNDTGSNDVCQDKNLTKNRHHTLIMASLILVNTDLKTTTGYRRKC